MSFPLPDKPSVERVAATADQLLRIAASLPNSERDEVCRQLSEHSAVIRGAHRWSEWFTVVFVAGTVALLGGVLVAVHNGSIWLVAILVPMGLVGVGAPAIKLWHAAWQALDVAIGAYLTSLPHDEATD